MNLLKVLARISGMTMISRILGFVRDTIIAQMFGSTAASDAFVVAFKLPNLLRRIFAEGAFSQAFVPILAEYKTKQSQDETVDFARYVAGLLGFILLCITIIGIIAAPIIIRLSAPGFVNNPDKFALSISLLRITFPYILLISLSSFVSSLLNAYNRFSIPAFTPVFLNLSMIAFALFASPYFKEPITALAWGVFVGGVIQLGFQLPFLHKIGFLRFPKLSFHNTGVNRVLKQMVPALFGVSVAQISLLINTIFASFLVDGSVSWMYYADRLMELPSGVLGVALGTLLLPTLSKHAAGEDTKSFSMLLDWGIKLTLLLAIPAAVGLASLANPLISTLFMYRAFNAHDVVMTQYALIAYSIGLVGLIFIKVLAPGFYAKQDIKTPVKIAIISLIVTQLSNLALIWNFKHVGLSLAISIGACLNATLLYLSLRKRNVYTPENGIFKFAIRVLLASIVMFATLSIIQCYIPMQWDIAARYRILQLLGLIIAGIFTYFGSLYALGFRISQIRKVF